MKSIFAIVCFLAITSTIQLLPSLSEGALHPIHKRDMAMSSSCSGRGYMYADRCYCLQNFKGDTCQYNGYLGWDDTPDKCDDLTARLDHLFNESEDYMTVDDNEFPRLEGDSIGEAEAQYGEKGNTWIKMHDMKGDFSIFSNSQHIKATDINQGALGNCYLLAALASLANIRNGQPIRDMFQTKTDNDNHIYVTRWMLDGKVRMVATDDYIPGQNLSPAFSTVSNDGQYWGLIIEKAWAKIHGDYMTTQGGWQTDVWKSITAAPIDQFKHEDKSVSQVWTAVKQMLNNQWAVGAATTSNNKKDLVQGHAYAILKTIEVGSVQLIQCYNPWAKEKWEANSWAEDSSLWTQQIKDAVGDFEIENDGVIYLTPRDYYDQFGYTNWAEIKEGYGQEYRQVALKGDQEYSVDFYNSQSGNLIQISVDQADERILNKCSAPFRVTNIKVTDPNGQSSYGNYESMVNVISKKIESSIVGTYKVQVWIKDSANFHKFFTVNTYSKIGTVDFTESYLNRQSAYSIIRTKSCSSHNDCSRHGICNTYSGVCSCDLSYRSRSDCSVKSDKKCPSDCSGNGVCQEGDICQCNNGYSGTGCQTFTQCKDAQSKSQCDSWSEYCPQKPYEAQMSRECALTCKFCTSDSAVRDTAAAATCESYKSQGACTNSAYQAQMKRECELTCNLEHVVIACTNSNTEFQCTSWKSAGYCPQSKYEAFLTRECDSTCFNCQH